MKMTKKSRYILLTGISLTMAAYLLTQGQGCSASDSVQRIRSSVMSSSNVTGVGSSNTELGVSPPPAEEMTIIPNSKTVSVTYSGQILEQFSTCLGVRPSDRTIAMYETKKGSISTYGTANTITSPMMMSIVSVSGEICQDLIEQEVQNAPGRIFKDVGFNANTLVGNNTLRDAISRLALSCWQRKETSEEATAIIDSINQSISMSESMANRKAALLICTSMLSSLDGIAN